MSLELTPQQSPILLVEDSEDDVLLIRRAFERAGVRNPLRNVRTGWEAVSYLKGDPPYRDRAKNPLPALVLLDIQLPLMDGFHVLKWIRLQPELAWLSVVMLTASDELADVNLAYQLGAKSFLVKPLDFWTAAELSRTIQPLLVSK